MADKILIVDDDPAICKLLEKVMHSNELETTTVNCGMDALSILKNHTFDLILMDIMLGDMEGFEVIKRLRNQGIQAVPTACTWCQSKSTDPPQQESGTRQFRYSGMRSIQL